jgi:hypothetical protein
VPGLEQPGNVFKRRGSFDTAIGDISRARCFPI